MKDQDAPDEEVAHPRLDNRQLGLLFGVPVVAAVILYWPSLRLPLIYDDLLHIRIGESLDFITLWLPTEAFGFYRPLTFLPLLLIREIFGYFPAWLLHGLNVGQHALNVALLALLSWRLWGRTSASMAAGLLFAFFPFSYQAIAVYGHNVHPATAGLLLLAIHAYLTAVGSKRPRRWWALTATIFFFSLLSHESAVLFGPLAGAAQWGRAGARIPPGWRDPGRLLRNAARQPWFAFSLLGLLYAIGYQFIPLSRAPQASFDGGVAWTKGAYLLQSAAFPISWLGRWTGDIGPTFIVVTAFLATLAMSIWRITWQPATRGPLLAGWIWWAMASILIAVPLPAAYLLHGPRLLYLGSVGVAWIWAALLFPPGRLSGMAGVIGLAVLVFTLAVGGLLVRDRLSAYDHLGDPIYVARETLAGRSPEEGLVLVNLPQWVAPRQGIYPLGVELAAVLGDYLFVEELVALNLDQDRPVKAWVAPDLLVERNYTYALHQGDIHPLESWAPVGLHVIITDIAEEGPQSRYTGYTGPAEGENGVAASFGIYELLSAEAYECEHVVRLTSSWRKGRGQSGDDGSLATTSLFVQLLSGDGQMLAQADGPLLGLRADLLNVPSSWDLDDYRTLAAPESSTGVLLLGVYDFATGRRYPAVDDDGPLADNALVLAIEPCPP